MSTKTIVGNWKLQVACVACNAIIDIRVYRHVNGICPKCGNDDDSTIMDVKRRSIRNTYTVTKKWWQLWVEPVVISTETTPWEHRGREVK